MSTSFKELKYNSKQENDNLSKGLTVLARIIARAEATLIFGLDKEKNLERSRNKLKLENNFKQ